MTADLRVKGVRLDERTRTVSKVARAIGVGVRRRARLCGGAHRIARIRIVGRLAALAVVAAAFLAAPAPSGAVHGCHVGDTRVIARSRNAIVMQKRHYAADESLYVYGCLFRKGAVYRLNMPAALGAAYVKRPIVLAGRYVAYVSEDEAPAGYGEFESVTARDLVTGKVIHYAGGSESDYDSSYPINVIVMNRKGWVAWTSFDRAGDDGSGNGRPEHQLHVQTTTGGRKGVLIDHGPKLDARSLRLARDGRAISWRNAGVLHRAPFG